MSTEIDSDDVRRDLAFRWFNSMGTPTIDRRVYATARDVNGFPQAIFGADTSDEVVEWQVIGFMQADPFN